MKDPTSVWGRYDEWLIESYQQFVADPLQLRGVSLVVQFRFWNAATAAEMIAALVDRLSQGPDEWPWTLIYCPGIAVFVSGAIFADQDRLKPSETPSLNLLRVLVPAMILRIFWSLAVASAAYNEVVRSNLTNLFTFMWFATFFLSVLSDSCQPKFPRPRRAPLRLGVVEQ